MGEGPSSVIQEQLQDYPFFKEIYKGSMWIEEKLSALKDNNPDVYEHSLRVAFLASEISIFMDLSYEERLDLTKSALLHDFGKIFVAKELLEAGVLSKEDKAKIDIHVRAGYEEIKGYDPLLAKIMVGHHEFQPKPYPRQSGRLEDDREIRKLQFLLALCDGVDALLSTRSYKEEWLPDDVQKTLTEQFVNPSLVDFAINTRLRITLKNQL